MVLKPFTISKGKKQMKSKGYVLYGQPITISSVAWNVQSISKGLASLRDFMACSASPFLQLSRLLSSYQAIVLWT